MKAAAAFAVGDVVCPLPRTLKVVRDSVVLPGGDRIRHSEAFNVTVVSHFVVARTPIAVDEEITVNLNLVFYDMISKSTASSVGTNSFEEPIIQGFRYLCDLEKQQLYSLADESVRKDAIADGFLPHGPEGGITVVRTKHDTLVAAAAGEHAAASVVFEATGVLLPFPVRSTIEVPGDRHLRLTGGSEFIRHSCLPNLRLEVVGNAIRGIALRPVEDGEHLTYNYLCTEWEVCRTFNCSCNKYCCYGVIRGFEALDREQQEHLLPQCSAAVREKYCALTSRAITGDPRGGSIGGAMAVMDATRSALSAADGEIVAQRYIASGTILITPSSPPKVERDRLVLGPVRLTHSCDANTVMVGGRLVSARPLLAGDQLSFNLSLLSYALPAPFACHCGSACCTGEVTGFGALASAHKDALWSYASDEARHGAMRRGHTLSSTSPLIQVRPTAQLGHATYAAGAIPDGTRIFHVKGLVLPFPTVYTIYLGDGKHIQFTGGAQCLAHSCTPNTRIVVDPLNGSFDCFSITDITAGDLVSFNYLTTEWDMDAPFTCACGSGAACHGRIAGFRHLHRHAQLSLWPTATQAVRSLFSHSSNAIGSVLATLQADTVAPCSEHGGEWCVRRDLPSGVVLLEAPQEPLLQSAGHCSLLFGDVPISHSCDPSAAYVEGRVVLRRSATAGTPITLNANELFYQLPEQLDCQCGSPACVGLVGGFAGLTDTQKEAALLCALPGVRAEAVAAGYKNKSACALVDVRANGGMGQATFAATAIPAGSRFFRVTGLVLSFPTVYTILLEPGRHLLFADGAQCLAHSCDPNVRILVDAESRTLECLALRDIAAGELIAFNYLTTEWDMSAPFTCACGHAECHCRISGFKYLSAEARQVLWSNATPGIRSLAQSRPNWARLASADLRTDAMGCVRAARELREGLPVLDAGRADILDAGVLVVDGVRLRHSCRPTAAVMEHRVVLVQTLCPGDEVTVDLNCLRYTFDKPFTCHCAAEPRPHVVEGFRALSDELRAARIIFTEAHVRAAALRDGMVVPCSCALVDVRSNGDMGQATFASTVIPAGTRFLHVKGLSIPFPTVYTIMLSENRHLLFADGAQCLAHSCRPNVQICVDALNSTLECLALRDIAAGELIAFNYNSTEWNMNSSFRCLCGVPECAFDIRGFKYLSQHQRAPLQPYTTPAIRELSGAYTQVHLPPDILRADGASYLLAARDLPPESTVMDVPCMDIQPSQISVGRDCIIPHSSASNCVLVEGRIVTRARVAAGEPLTVNMNFIVYDLITLFRSGVPADGKGFKYMDEKLKQQYLYLCEPSVRAQAMRDGWIVKSTQEALTVRPNGDMGQTAYATRDIAVDTRLFHCTGLVVPFPTMYTICVGDHRHLLFGDAAECIAHHCDPNVRVDVHDDGTIDFVTIKAVRAGEMVTFNYCTTEWHMNTPFVCLCGSAACSGCIQGFKHLSDADRQRLWPITSDVVKQQCQQ